MNEAEFNHPAQDPYRPDSISAWLNEQDKMNFEAALENALGRHRDLYDKHGQITPAEEREMAAIQEAILSLMRINERLPRSDQ